MITWWINAMLEACEAGQPCFPPNVLFNNETWLLRIVWSEPTFRRVDLCCLSWADVIDVIAFQEAKAGQLIDAFHGERLGFNRPRARAQFPGRRSMSCELPVRCQKSPGSH
jgi:hypothetical protein